MPESKSQLSTAIILAAGKGTRMLSPLPKVLHPVAGKPMIQWPIEACQNAGFSEIRVVVGHGKELVKSVVEPLGAKTFDQKFQQGTADAVRSVKTEELSGVIVILNGDHPLIRAEDLKHAAQVFESSKLDVAVITAVVKNPGSLGRVVHHQGQFAAIVEAKDASSETLKIREVNSGLYFVRAEALNEALPRIGNQNQAREFYLTDIMTVARELGYSVGALKLSARVAFGVNTQKELARATKYIFKKRAEHWMEQGCIMLDPATAYIEDSVVLESGVVLYPNVHLRGSTRVGTCSVIENNCVIQDSVIQPHASIKANSHLDSCTVGSAALIGPFARLRPKADIGPQAHIGNFVEIKNAKIGARSKANHHTYLGDAEIGEDSNIGCGTITCNYAADKKKYKTIIGDRVFVGSDSQFVAPVKVGNDAVIGSGSTITKDVPERALAIARSKQWVKEGYVKPEPPIEEEEGEAAHSQKAGE